jgi:hypothetical protein
VSSTTLQITGRGIERPHHAAPLNLLTPVVCSVEVSVFERSSPVGAKLLGCFDTLLLVDYGEEAGPHELALTGTTMKADTGIKTVAGLVIA